MGEWVMGIIATVLVGIIMSIVGADARTLIPRLCRRLIKYSASTISEQYSDRLEEEWLSHFDDATEISAKLWHSMSIFFYGAPKIGRQVGFQGALLHKSREGFIS